MERDSESAEREETGGAQAGKVIPGEQVDYRRGRGLQVSARDVRSTAGDVARNAAVERGLQRSPQAGGAIVSEADSVRGRYDSNDNRPGSRRAEEQNNPYSKKKSAGAS